MNSDDKRMESLEGIIERITYHNTDNGYCVLRVKAKKQKDLVTVVGHASLISAGELIQASGVWINDKSYGPQFKAMTLETCPPITEEGIEKYLSSGLIKGIGPVFAKKLVKAFGTDVFTMIETSADALKKIEGIGPHRLSMITRSWEDQKMIREIMIFLYQYGISTARAVRIYKTYGSDSIDSIKQNPYILAKDIRGIGFKSADQIAQKIGILKESPLRIRAGLSHVLLEAMEEGHCGLPRLLLLKATAEALDISEESIHPLLDQELNTGELKEDTLHEEACIFLKGLYFAEKNIAKILEKVNGSPVPWGFLDVSVMIPWVEETLGLTLATSQKQALKLILKSKVSVITGGPGVGKTTLIKSLLTILLSQNTNVLLAAPTGRAAKRLSETTGQEAKTIHRLLDYDPVQHQFKRNEGNTLTCQLMIVDEVSMLDISLMHALLKALPLKAAIIFVGDIDQLPSVGPGSVLEALIHSKAFPVARLTEIFRQSAESSIIKNAHRMNHGQMPLLPEKNAKSDFYFIETDTPEACKDIIIDLVKTRIPQIFHFNPITDIQVLCPMNRGGVGTRSLNIDLQQALNGSALDKSSPHKVERFGTCYGIGDKVMQITNNYTKEVYNGDSGYIRDINIDDKELVIDYEGRCVSYDFDELDEVVLAYATTIHKSQGSEYPVIVIPFMMQHYPMLQRNLLYTGMTRGKELVVLVGQKKALSFAIRNDQAKQRYTKLKEWLDVDQRHKANIDE